MPADQPTNTNLGRLKKAFLFKFRQNASKPELSKKEKLKNIALRLKTVTWEDMQQIPAGEEDLYDIAVHITMLNKKAVDLMPASEIKSATLRNIYQGNKKEAVAEFDKLQAEKIWEGDFQFDLLMAFWLSVHMEDIELTTRFMNQDIYLRQLVALALKRKPEMPAGYKKQREKFELKSPGLRKRQSTKQKSPAKSKDVTQLIDQKEGGDSEGSFVESGQDEEEESEYDQEGEGEYDSEEAVERELEWTAPNILTNKLLQSIDSDEIEKETGINLFENIGGGDNTEVTAVLIPKNIRFNNQHQEAFLKQIGVTGWDIELTQIFTEKDIKQIKNSFRLRFPLLMANIVKILLYRQEIGLACTLTAYYELSLDEDMIFNAIDCKLFQWLSYVWAFGKNYIGARRNKGKKLVYEDFFTALKQMRSNSKNIAASQKFFSDTLRIVCQWYTYGEDDILRALLLHFQDEIVLEFYGYYKKFITTPLFLYALQHDNKIFMQGALLMGAFDTQQLNNDDVILAILVYFSDGSKTNYILNVLLACDVTLWKNKWLKELISMFENFSNETYEKNRIMLSYNPMMTIALSADLLTRIGEGRRRFKDKCTNLKKDILELGRVFNMKIEDKAYYQSLIIDKDFNSRTVLNIICNNNFGQLMHDSDPKAEDLIMEMWEGKEATRCDGNIFGYSNLAHILFKKSQKVTDPNTSFYAIISNYFEVNLKVDYTFQFRYRTKSIEFYFQNELLMSIILLALFQYILNDYREVFKGRQQYYETTYNEDGTVIETILNQEVNGNIASPLQDFIMVTPINQYQNNITQMSDMMEAHKQYNNWLYYVVALCSIIVFSFIQKIIFNIFASINKRPTVKTNKWQIFDLLNAAATSSFNVIIYITPTFMLNYEESPDTKYYINFFCVFVSVISFLRCFLLFLMISKLSKMLLTLQGVVEYSLSFLFLLGIFLFIASAIFTSLFQNTNPDYFATMHSTVVKMFNAMVNFYDYLGNQQNTSVYAMMCIQFQAFLFNIIFINYLIAVMATAYNEMSQAGSFMYKVNLFNYCERYLIAFNDKAYGEIQLHPAPICVLTAPLTLCAFILPQKYMVKMSLLSSYIIHWIENIILLVVFAIFELLLVPFVYFKNIFIIVWASMGLFTTMFNLAAWIFAGPFFCIFIAGRDVLNLAKIFSMQDGCKAAFGIKDELEIEEVDDKKEIEAYNGTRHTVLEQYFEIRKQFYKSKDPNYEVPEEEKVTDFDNLDVLQMLEVDDEKMFGDLDENQKDRAKQIFVIKMTTIHDEWRKKVTKRIPVADSAKKETATVNQLQNQRKQKLEDNLIDKQGGMSEVIIRQMIDNQGGKEDDEQEAEEEIVLSADDILDKCVETFLEKFLIGSDKSTFLDNIDIVLMLRALPIPIVNFNMEQAKLFNFSILQSAIIAFLNQDIVNSFEFFDVKNRDRVQIVRDLIIKQKTGLDTVESIVTEVKTKVQSNEKILIEFTEMWDQLQSEKKELIDREIEANYASQNVVASKKKKASVPKKNLK